jgi:hypothetical protein
MQRTPLHLAVAATLVAAAAIPSSASAAEPDMKVAARLEARANADTTQAAALAGRSTTTARRTLTRARSELTQAYRLTMGMQGTAGGAGASSVQASTQFAAALDRNDAALDRLVDKSDGRLEVAAARALDRNAAMRAEVTLGLASDAGKVDGPGEASLASAATELARGHADTTVALVARLDAPGTVGRTRGALRTAAVRAVEDEKRIAAALGRLYRSVGSESQGPVGVALDISIQVGARSVA